MESFIFIVILLAVLVSALVGFFIIGRWLYNRFYEDEEPEKPHEESLGNPKAEQLSIEEEEVEDILTNDKPVWSNNMKKIDFKNSITVRFAIIGLIALMMLIPLGKIGSVVDERSGLYDKVLHNIASQWGSPQEITGPVLVIPITEKYDVIETSKDAKGREKQTTKVVRKERNIIVLPKHLQTKIALQEHYRYRGIYKSLVYGADVAVEGDFILPDIMKLTDHLETVHYQKAYMVMGLSDPKAIEEVSGLSFGVMKASFEPGTKLGLKGIKAGFHAPLALHGKTSVHPFHFTLKANGSSYLRFSAFGEKSKIMVNSSWEHPSFQGAILPTKRQIGAGGFEATWEIPSLARNFPQTWIYENHAYNLGSLLTGVDLYEPVALYSLVNRSIKYGVLFILLTFLTFLIFEVTQKSKLHYVQYVLIGFSLGLFFLVLLSLSEHIAFLSAYVVASAITIVSISLYTWFSSRSKRHASMIFALLLALYAILYSLLQMEDYALLMGTGLLLTVLLVLMWITRHLRVE